MKFEQKIALLRRSIKIQYKDPNAKRFNLASPEGTFSHKTRHISNAQVI